jgi:hypothetical protein
MEITQQKNLDVVVRIELKRFCGLSEEGDHWKAFVKKVMTFQVR